MRQTAIRDLEEDLHRLFLKAEVLVETAQTYGLTELEGDARGILTWAEACESRTAARRITQSAPKLPKLIEYVVPF
jgi:hypothetical protein